MAGLDFLVARNDLRRTRIAPAELPDLRDGAVLLEIDRFGFSTNNVTYASLGEAMRYWQFFPGPQGWGRVPVWGYARISDSTCDGLETGERVFGYLPMSTHLVVSADGVTDRGFVDAAPHRAELPAVYQRYLRVRSDARDAGSEDQQALWLPLFMTSFGAADFIADRDLFGAERVVISSASSKTAMGTAFLLQEQFDPGDLVALTSERHVVFAERTGYYGRVLSYRELRALASGPPLVLLDFAGNTGLVAELQRELGDRLRHTVVIGATHWEERDAGIPLDRSNADFFFLPPWMEKRRREWGPGAFGRRYDEAWARFLPTVGRWMTVERRRGPDAVERVYRSMLEGNVDPSVGHILSLAR